MGDMSTEREERRRVWKRRGKVFLTATFWFVLWSLYLALGSFLFVYLEAENSYAIKADTRRNIEERLHEIWELGMEAGLDQRQYPLPNDTLIVQALIHDLAPDIGLKEPYDWDFQGGFHFCLTVVSTIGFGHLSPKTQIGQLVCILYGSFGIILNFKVMRGLGASTTNIIYAFYRVLVAMTPKFLRVSRCCPVEKAIVLVESQRPSAPDVPTNYRSDIYGNSSAHLDSSSVPRAKMAWTIDGSTKDHNRYHDHVESLNDMAPSSSTFRSGTETAEHPSVVIDDSEHQHETIKNDAINSRSPVWFAFLIGFIWIAFSSGMLQIQSYKWEEGGWTYITCTYFQFIMMSTIGFGDKVIGKLPQGGILAETIFTIGGLLALSAILENVIHFCDRKDTILKSKCIMCCRKRARKK